jgi:uncharacterized protein (TIGR03067 family)
MAGSWELLKVVADGKELPAPEGKKRVLVLEGTRYVVRLNDEKIGGGTLSVNPKTKPASIDVTPSEGENKDKVMPGVYEIKGDEMKVCVANPGKDRPKEFEAKADSGHVLVTYKRVKK